MNQDLTDRIHEMADYYGINSRLNQLQEEMAELTQAACKFYRIQHGEPCRMDYFECWENMLEEIADVMICLEQLIYLMQNEKRFKPLLKDNGCLEIIHEKKANRAYADYQKMKSERAQLAERAKTINDSRIGAGGNR